MEPKPVQQGRTPGYPTRREVLAGAASFVLVGLTGRGLRCFAEAAASGEIESGETIVAPIFEHGEGRGASGCIVMMPPVFLSEEEGMQILREELGRQGIHLMPGGTLRQSDIPASSDRAAPSKLVVDEEYARALARRLPMHEVPLRFDIVPEDMHPPTEMLPAGTSPRPSWLKGSKRPEPVVNGILDGTEPLPLDGLDAEKRVAILFVSRKNYGDLGGEPSNMSVQAYEFKGIAERVAAAAKDHGRDHVFLGIFYDPVMMNRPADLEEKAKAGDLEPLFKWTMQHSGKKKECADLLRQQAEEFVVWLKKQDAIARGSETSSGSDAFFP